jgi:microcystin-dependent protein
MATVTPGIVWTSGETVTPAKLNSAAAPTVTLTAEERTPAGAVMAFAMNSAPTGWLEADGTAVSRSTYAALFSAIGTTYGAGDGSTTFALPDLRGIFVRGSGEQTISGTAYSGTFAQKLRDQMQTITGSFRAFARIDAFSGAFTDGGQFSGGFGQAGGQGNDHTYNFSSANSSGARTGTETRPANIALLYCIKF